MIIENERGGMRMEIGRRRYREVERDMRDDRRITTREAESLREEMSYA